MSTEKPSVLTHWLCSLHGIYCSNNSPCWECRKEVLDPSVIEEMLDNESCDKIRRKNAYKGKTPSIKH